MLIRLLPRLLILLVLAACTAPTVQPELRMVHGVTLKSLQGGVNVSLATAAGQTGGNGVLFYQSPDRFRLTILAPFGQSLFDLIVTGDQVLCLVASKKQAWQGTVRDLPEGLGVRVWPLLTWVVEPPHPAGASLERTFVRPDGTVERVYYDVGGLVQRKINAAGDEVVYRNYRIADGLAVPEEMTVTTASGSSLRLVLDEPEVNRPIAADIFTPPLDQYEIHPLAEFRGF